jgi:hypothetical protein
MNMTRRKYLAKTGGVLLAASVLLGAARADQGQNADARRGPDVRVVNTQSEPVPVTLQGTARIDTSTPIPVKDLDHHPRQFVQFTLFAPGSGPYAVPAGKLLVIEFVSGSFATKSSDPTSIGEALLRVRTGASDFSHVFAGTVTEYDNGVPSPFRFAFSQVCRIYAGAGSEVSLRGGFALGAINVSGYLVDAP